jgi:large subunit ribosomal protein L19
MKNAVMKMVDDKAAAASKAAREKAKGDSQHKNFQVGDTLDVHLRILEGEKERTQTFTGVVISKTGSGLVEAFTVRRIVQGEGVERIFPLHSPLISRIEVKRTGVVRRAKLYYLRDRVGKATRLRERKPKA